LLFDSTCMPTTHEWCVENNDCLQGDFCTGDEFGTAMVNAYQGVQRIREWFVDLQPATEPLLPPLQVFANGAPGCNGFFNNTTTGPALTFLRSLPGRCHNSAFSTYIAHEFGHYLEWLLHAALTNGSEHSEGLSDAIAALSWNTPCIFRGHYYSNAPPPEGPGFWAEGNDNACIRNVERTCPGTCAGLPEKGCSTHYDCLANGAADYVGPCNFGTDCHNVREANGDATYGLAIAGAFWDLQKTLRCCSDDDDDNPLATCTDDPPVLCDVNMPCGSGQSCVDRPTEELLTDYLLLSSPQHPSVHGSFLENSTLLEILVADDDNADLRDGTPHCRQILCAFVGQDQCDDVPTECQFTAEDCPNETGGIIPGHGFECPDLDLDDLEDDGTVQVNWNHPIVENPVEGTDYEVNHQIEPPMITLKTTAVDDVPVLRARSKIT